MKEKDPQHEIERLRGVIDRLNERIERGRNREETVMREFSKLRNALDDARREGQAAIAGDVLPKLEGAYGAARSELRRFARMRASRLFRPNGRTGYPKGGT